MPNESDSRNESREPLNLGDRLAGIIADSAHTPSPLAKNSAQDLGVPAQNAEWNVIHAGKESGPFSRMRLVEMVGTGELDADDMVKQPDGVWVKAQVIPFLQSEFDAKKAVRPIEGIGEFRGVWLPKRTLLIAAFAFFVIAIVAAYWLRSSQPAGKVEVVNPVKIEPPSPDFTQEQIAKCEIRISPPTAFSGFVGDVYNGSNMSIRRIVLRLTTAEWTRDYSVYVYCSPLESQSFRLDFLARDAHLKQFSVVSISP